MGNKIGQIKIEIDQEENSKFLLKWVLFILITGYRLPDKYENSRFNPRINFYGTELSEKKNIKNAEFKL